MASALGLEMAKDLSISKLEFQMDNKACIEALQNANHHGGECFHLLKACRALIISDGWEVTLSEFGCLQGVSVVYYDFMRLPLQRSLLSSVKTLWELLLFV